jgi:large subunit ribosomal protein L9
VARRQAEAAKKGEEFRALANALSGKKVVLKSKAENGKLFGSVGREEIATALEAMSMTVDPHAIVLEKPYKETGEFAVTADFGHGIKAVFQLVIEAE